MLAIPRWYMNTRITSLWTRDEVQRPPATSGPMFGMTTGFGCRAAECRIWCSVLAPMRSGRGSGAGLQRGRPTSTPADWCSDMADFVADLEVCPTNFAALPILGKLCGIRLKPVPPAEWLPHQRPGCTMRMHGPAPHVPELPGLHHQSRQGLPLLQRTGRAAGRGAARSGRHLGRLHSARPLRDDDHPDDQLRPVPGDGGRASCRERVEISGVAVYLQK